MDYPKILITYGGNWKGNTYKGSLSEMLFVLSNLTYEALLVLVYEIVHIDPNRFVYDFRSLLNTHGKMARFKIQNDNDLQYVLRVGNEDYEVYWLLNTTPNNMWINQLTHNKTIIKILFS